MPSPTIHLLQIEPLPETILEELHKHFVIHQFTNIEALKPIQHDIRALTTGGSYGVSTDVLNHLPNLEIISVNGVGLDKIDLTIARKRNIRVSVTTDISTSDVADMAMMLLLNLKRRFSDNEDFLKNGEWANGALPLSLTLFLTATSALQVLDELVRQLHAEHSPVI